MDLPDGTRVEYDVSKAPSYIFKYIDIDEKIGHPLFIGEEVVGGFLLEWHFDFVTIKCNIKGIEIHPEYRKRGIARRLVEVIQDQAHMIIGAALTHECIPFWKKVGFSLYQTSGDSFLPVLIWCKEKEKFEETQKQLLEAGAKKLI